jgi:hypothetical protein
VRRRLPDRIAWQTPDGRVEHVFEPVLFVLALLVVPVVLVEESDAPRSVRDAAAVANWVIWIGFAAELLLIAAVARDLRSALRAHWLELAIVVVTPPFLPRVLGTLRLARLVRLLRLVRLGLLGGRAVRAERVLTSRQASGTSRS